MKSKVLFGILVLTGMTFILYVLPVKAVVSMFNPENQFGIGNPPWRGMDAGPPVDNDGQSEYEEGQARIDEGQVSIPAYANWIKNKLENGLNKLSWEEFQEFKTAWFNQILAQNGIASKPADKSWEEYFTELGTLGQDLSYFYSAVMIEAKRDYWRTGKKYVRVHKVEDLRLITMFGRHFEMSDLNIFHYDMFTNISSIDFKALHGKDTIFYSRINEEEEIAEMIKGRANFEMYFEYLFEPTNESITQVFHFKMRVMEATRSGSEVEFERLTFERLQELISPDFISNLLHHAYLFGMTTPASGGG